MQITISDSNQPAPEQPSSDGDPLIPKVKVADMLKTLLDLPGEAVPLAKVNELVMPFLSNRRDKEIYEKTTGYVQILDEVLKQLKTPDDPAAKS